MKDGSIEIRATTRIVVGEPPVRAERPYNDSRIGFVHSVAGDELRTIVFVPEALRELADEEP